MINDMLGNVKMKLTRKLGYKESHYDKIAVYITFHECGQFSKESVEAPVFTEMCYHDRPDRQRS